jgi:GH18 family chitinase
MQTRMDNKRENIFRHEYHDAHEKTIQPKQSKRVGDKRPGSQQHFSVSIPRFNPMKKSLSVFLLAVMSAAGAIVNAINFNSTSVDVALANIPVAAQLSKKFVAYFIAWGIYGRNYQPSDIPADKLTHINYAFANIDASGRVALGDSYADIDKAYPGDSWDTSLQPFRGTFNQIMNVIRKEHPHLKVLLSVGGWTWSAKFSDVAKDDGGRETFAQSCLDMIEKYGFDGIDIDWEYPVEGGLSSNVYRPEDGANYVLLLNAIRAKIGSEKLLTIASAAGPQLTRHLDIPGLASVLDFVNIMTYDFRGGWSKFTGQSSSIFLTCRSLHF